MLGWTSYNGIITLRMVRYTEDERRRQKSGKGEETIRWGVNELQRIVVGWMVVHKINICICLKRSEKKEKQHHLRKVLNPFDQKFSLEQ